jgi:hypothetical protein
VRFIYEDLKNEIPKKTSRVIRATRIPNPVHAFAAASGLALAGLVGVVYELQSPLISPPLTRPDRFSVAPQPQTLLFIDPLIQTLGTALEPTQSHTAKAVLDALYDEEDQNKADDWLLSAMAHTMVKDKPQEQEQEHGHLPNTLPNVLEDAPMASLP